MGTKSEMEQPSATSPTWIKLYAAQNECDIDSPIYLIRIDSNIGMSFGLDKCGRMVSRSGGMITSEGVELLEGNKADVQDSYRYLGIPQTNNDHKETTLRSVTAKYYRGNAAPANLSSMSWVYLGARAATNDYFDSQLITDYFFQ